MSAWELVGEGAGVDKGGGLWLDWYTVGMAMKREVGFVETRFYCRLIYISHEEVDPLGV